MSLLTRVPFNHTAGGEAAGSAQGDVADALQQVRRRRSAAGAFSGGGGQNGHLQGAAAEGVQSLVQVG